MIKGKITDIDQNGITIFASYDNIDRAILREYREVQVGLSDGRTISADQRRKAYALMGEIAEWMGELPDFVKRLMKLDFVTNRLQSLQKQIFSLSDTDVTTAKEFISFLIEFMLEHSVPSRTPLYELCEDIEKYVYACLITKKCCVCGKKGDLHHVDRIGLGGDRTTKYQIGMRVISLCPVCHGKAHTKGDSWLNDMHLVPVKLTVEIGKKYNLSKKSLGA